MENSDICNYADDNTLIVADKNIDIIITKLESDIKHLNSWFIDNGMLLNGYKCQFMLIGSSRNPRHYTESISIAGKRITECEMSRLLGITFDIHLTMNEHIKNI